MNPFRVLEQHLIGYGKKYYTHVFTPSVLKVCMALSGLHLFLPVGCRSLVQALLHQYFDMYISCGLDLVWVDYAFS